MKMNSAHQREMKCLRRLEMMIKEYLIVNIGENNMIISEYPLELCGKSDRLIYYLRYNKSGSNILIGEYRSGSLKLLDNKLAMILDGTREEILKYVKSYIRRLNGG